MNPELLKDLGYVPLEDVAPMLGSSLSTAKDRAGRGKLPVQCVQAGSRESPWLVPKKALQKHLAEKAAQAAKDKTLMGEAS